jgi:cytidylate kinase
LSRPEEVQIYLGLNGILYADSIQRKLRKLKEMNERIESKFERIEAELKEEKKKDQNKEG